jgi:hypothetical protein
LRGSGTGNRFICKASSDIRPPQNPHRPTLAGLQANIAALDNRAVFEIPEILERLLSS